MTQRVFFLFMKSMAPGVWPCNEVARVRNVAQRSERGPRTKESGNLQPLHLRHKQKMTQRVFFLFMKSMAPGVRPCNEVDIFPFDFC